MNDQPILVADIGGTYARFATVSATAERFERVQSLHVKDFDSIYAAIKTYLTDIGVSQLSAMCLAIACPIRGELVSFPNNHWSLTRSELQRQFRIDTARLINDWEAVAISLTALQADHFICIDSETPKLDNSALTLAAIGAGSGLGMAGVSRRNERLLPVVSEGGHVGFSPESQLQLHVLEFLHNHLGGRVSRERLLSGPGIRNIHTALCAIHDQPSQDLQSAEIAAAAFDQGDQLCLQTFDFFFEALGQVAGDIALSFGAYDGVFIGGGICQRYPEQLLASRFRHGFENKGRYRDLISAVPTCLLTHQYPGLLGASVIANQPQTKHDL